MQQHKLRVYPSKEKLDRKDQLAWKLAELCTDTTPIKDDVVDMIINRVIDNASVAIAAANRHSVASVHPRRGCNWTAAPARVALPRSRSSIPRIE